MQSIGEEHETIVHLFFACSFNAYIWELCRLKMGLQPGPIGGLLQEAIYSPTTFNPKVKLYGIAKLAL